MISVWYDDKFDFCFFYYEQQFFFLAKNISAFHVTKLQQFDLYWFIFTKYDLDGEFLIRTHTTSFYILEITINVNLVQHLFTDITIINSIKNTNLGKTKQVIITYDIRKGTGQVYSCG